ncbi:Rv3212 family protein, partial [Prauserella halophila]|uniref:Rv3212 family protein n=1 Tax=Prauserella halophila TaxID=185641 RepID=UPI0031CFC20A
GSAPATVRSRRSPWNRRRDRDTAALLGVGAVVAGVVVWAGSDSRATISETAPPPAHTPAQPASVPAEFHEAWRAPSAATPAPVATAGTVVTADGGEVTGRDPGTGDVRWRYARDLPLCTVGAEWERALALHRTAAGCSEVTQLDAETGRRTAQRNGDAEHGTRLIGDGGYVTATGDRLLNSWRDDLVRSMEFGQVYAQVNAGYQPRPDCEYGTVATASGRVGVIERCPGRSGALLTVLKAAPEESDQPEQEFSQTLPERGAKLIAMVPGGSAVLLPEAEELVLYDPEGRERTRYPLDLPQSDLDREPSDGVMPTARGPQNVYWFTGSRTMALSTADLTPKWTVHNTRGAGTSMAGRYLAPVGGGLAVLDPRSGDTVRTIAVDRDGYRGPIETATAGPVVLERRGDEVVALR